MYVQHITSERFQTREHTCKPFQKNPLAHKITPIYIAMLDNNLQLRISLSTGSAE